MSGATGHGRRRRLTSALLACAALAFLLPFGTVPSGPEGVSFRGVELVTFTLDTGASGRIWAEELEADGGAFAVLVLASAVVGAHVAALRERGGGYAASGLIGLVLLWWQAQALYGGPSVDYGLGYTVALLALAAAGLIRLMARLQVSAR
jgi:hypothetical protein